LNLESRLEDIHNGSNGSANMKVNGATLNLEDRADTDGNPPKPSWDSRALSDFLRTERGSR
jgi:hypothetical protein